MQLLRRVRAALGNDGPAIATVQVHALDGTIVQIRNAHVGPVDVTRLAIDDHTIGYAAAGDEHLLVRAVGIDREDPPAAQVEHEQSATRGLTSGCAC